MVGGDTTGHISGGFTASDNDITCPAMSTTTGRTLVAFFRHDPNAGAAITGVTDTAGNAYTKDAAASGTDLYSALMTAWYAYNITGNASNVITAAISGNVVYRTYDIHELNIASASNPHLDGDFATGNSTALATPSLSIGAAASATVVAFTCAPALGQMPGSGYTLTTFNLDFDSTQYFGSETKVITAGEAATATANTGQWAISAMTFGIVVVSTTADVAFTMSPFTFSIAAVLGTFPIPPVVPVAGLQARAGIMRAGATRVGYFTPNVVTTINGVNYSAWVARGPGQDMSIDLALNEEPDSARFTLKPGAPAPAAGQLVSIALGAVNHPIFGGQILRVTHRRRRGNNAPWIDVECSDWLLLFDRRLIYDRWDYLSASDIVRDIVSRWVSGFTALAVQDDLDIIPLFEANGEPPSKVLSRLAALVNGGHYIDAIRDVHFFGPAGETGPRAPTQPLTLANDLISLKGQEGSDVGFLHGYDHSQVRTRVIVEGRSAKILTDVPAGVNSFPVEFSWMFDPNGGKILLGPDVLDYYHARGVAGTWGAAALVTADAAVGDGSIQVYDNSAIVAAGTYWFHDEAGNLFFGVVDVFVGSTLLLGIPDVGYGSILVPIPAGTWIYSVDMIDLGVTLTPRDITAGETATVYVQAESGLAGIIAVEGGDGVHDYRITDDTLSYDGAASAATAALTRFNTPLLTANWETEDMNAVPGAQQPIALTTTDPLSATLTITKVSISFPVPNYRPRRICEASTVKVAGLLDVMTTGD